MRIPRISRAGGGDAMAEHATSTLGSGAAGEIASTVTRGGGAGRRGWGRRRVQERRCGVLSICLLL